MPLRVTQSRADARIDADDVIDSRRCGRERRRFRLFVSRSENQFGHDKAIIRR